MDDDAPDNVRRRRKRDVPTFASEAALCAAFSAEMTRQGWTPYPETSGWDILLVGHGLQVGVEAKLKPNLAVLAQWIGRVAAGTRGPDYAVVLVPYVTEDFCTVARALGATMVFPDLAERWRAEGTKLVPGDRSKLSWLPLLDCLEHSVPLFFEEAAWVPPVVPANSGGSPCPVQLTEWKLLALRLVARLELRGYVTVADFRDLGLNSSIWYSRWLSPAGGGERPQRWVRRPTRVGVPRDLLADEQHPEMFRVVLAEERELLLRLPPPPEPVSSPAPAPLPLFDGTAP